VIQTSAQGFYSISKSIMSLLPSPCRATALSAARRLDTIDLEMELERTEVLGHKKKCKAREVGREKCFSLRPLGLCGEAWLRL
jgi:hypothetical protein